MADNERSVYERLDSIEATQSATQAQNEEIIGLLKNLNNQQPVQQIVERNPKQQISDQQLLRDFFKTAKKEHIWCETINEFNQSKIIVIILCVALLLVGVISTVLTSIALKLYSIFSLFENIWLIFACIMFSHSIHLKRRMSHTDLRDHSITEFIQDEAGTWRDNGKEKKRYICFRTISYGAVIGNIIVIWFFSQGAIAITATILELAFAGLSIGLRIAYADLFGMYGLFILYTGKNASNTKNITLVFNVAGNTFAPYEDYKEKFKDRI